MATKADMATCKEELEKAKLKIQELEAELKAIKDNSGIPLEKTTGFASAEEIYQDRIKPINNSNMGEVLHGRN